MKDKNNQQIDKKYFMICFGNEPGKNEDLDQTDALQISEAIRTIYDLGYTAGHEKGYATAMKDIFDD